MKATLYRIYTLLRIPVLIIAGLVAMYAMAGFWLVPHLLKTTVMERLSETTGRRFSLDHAQLNPFKMTLDLEGLRILEADETPFFELETFATRFKFGSIFADAYEVEFLELGAPRIHLRRLESGALNLADMIPAAEVEEELEEEAATVPLRIEKLAIRGGRVQFRDEATPEDFSATVEPIDFEILGLSTMLDESAAYTLKADSDLTKVLSLEGTVSLTPLRAAGTIGLDGFELARLGPYVDALSNFRLQGGHARISGGFQFDGSGKEIAFQVQQGAARIDDIKLTSTDATDPAMALQRLSLEGLAFDSEGQTLTLKSIAAQKPEVILAGNGNSRAALDVVMVDALKYDLKEETLAIKRVAAKDAVFDDQGDGEKPHIQFGLASMIVDTLNYNLARQTLGIRKASAEKATFDDRTGKNQLVNIPWLAVETLQIDLEGRQVDIAKVASSGAQIEAWLNPDGTLNYAALFPAEEAETESEKPPESAAEPHWSVELAELALDDYGITFQDRSLSEPVTVALNPLKLRIGQFSTRPGSRLKLDLDSGVNDGGRLAVNGSLALEPLTAELAVKVEQVDLSDFQPYLDPFLDAQLRRGKLNVDGNINLGRAEDKILLAYRGHAAVTNFSLADGTTRREVVGWNRLNFANLRFDLEPMRLEIDDIAADQPFVEFTIEADGSTNFSRLVKTPPAEDTPAEPVKVEGETMPLNIATIRVKEGSTQFADRTTRPHFSTGIYSLNGALKGLSSETRGDAKLYLEGQVDKYAPVKIQGVVNPFAVGTSTDIEMKFENVNLTTLTPYTGRFAGYAIDKGKMSLNLNYQIVDHRLQASNRIILDQLTLGERVESPQATSLPVALAIALLKDRHGRIDLNLPIRGDLDDPQFSIGRLLGRTLVTLIQRAVASPFSLLANLVGTSAKLDQVEFAPGQATLDDEAQTKLNQVAEALNRRPALKLEVRGIADREADTLALARYKLQRKIRVEKYRRLPRDQRPDRIDAVEVTDAEYRLHLPDLYKEMIGSYAALEAADEEERLRRAEAALLKDIDVEEVELRVLAQTRALAIREFLVDGLNLPERRVFLMDVRVEQLDAAETIASRLSVGG